MLFHKKLFDSLSLGGRQTYMINVKIVEVPLYFFDETFEMLLEYK